MFKMKLNFYTGQDCHLCKLAEQLLADLKSTDKLQVSKYDVKQDHDLYHLYGARIPVLKRLDNNSELGWPFDSKQLQEFID